MCNMPGVKCVRGKMKLDRRTGIAEVREHVVVYTVVKEGFRDEGTFQQRTGRSELCRNLR